jgi:DNA polymerase II small subunit
MEFFEAGEMLVSPDALELLATFDEPEAFAGKVLAAAKERGVLIVSKEFVLELRELEEEKKIPLPVQVERAPGFKPEAKEWAASLKFVDGTDVTGRSRCKGTVEDFVVYFKDRLARTRKILEARGGNAPVSSKAMGGLDRGHEVRIIGLVSSKRPTKKGDLLLELEDEEGLVKVWVGKGRNDREKAVFQAANMLLLDEAVAIDGKWGGQPPFVIASEVVWPEVPIRAKKTLDRHVAAAFLSDLHVGSKLFLEKEFGSFIKWLNGNAGAHDQRQLAGRIKYLVIAGDVADGIGIYPRQEKELVVRDIFEQYRICAKFLQQVPDYVEIIVAPGNHDAVRRAEPQPALSGEVKDAFSHLPNVHLVGNPSMAEIEGFSTLIYHGTSLDSVIAALPDMSYANPEKPMVELVRRRNLSPLFGENPIVPEQRDFMVMEKLPDIVHMGHVHKNGYQDYRGIVLINSGTWQARTEFQAKQGHMPSPCILPVYDLRGGEIAAVNFSGEKPGGEG